MTFQSHGFSVEDALARSQEVCEVEFDFWGQRLVPAGAPPASPNLQYPPPGARAIPSTLAAIAIGPRSTVDRCWVSWDRQKILVVPPGDVPDPQAVISPSRIVTVGAPLTFSQATRVGTLGQTPPGGGAGQSIVEAMQQGIMYVFPWGSGVDPSFNPWAESDFALMGRTGQTTVLPDTYISMFGTAISFTDIREAPFLHLLLYLKLPAFSPPTKRALLQRSATWSKAPADGGYVARIPIFGRKTVAVQFISHNVSGIPSQIVDYRVGLVRNINESNVGAPSPVFEAKAGEALAVPKDTPAQFVINNPCADYVTLHVQNGAIGPAGGAWTVVAED